MHELSIMQKNARHARNVRVCGTNNEMHLRNVAVDVRTRPSKEVCSGTSRNREHDLDEISILAAIPGGATSGDRAGLQRLESKRNLPISVTKELLKFIEFDESKLGYVFRPPLSVGGEDEWSLNNAPESLRSGRCKNCGGPKNNIASRARPSYGQEALPCCEEFSFE